MLHPREEYEGEVRRRLSTVIELAERLDALKRGLQEWLQVPDIEKSGKCRGDRR